MRTLLFILLPICSFGQIYVDSYRFGGGAANLLLDDYPGAAAAYSLRLLDKDYTGDCITVRRKSDNALDTFGFVNNYLDTTSLKSFCGTGATDTCWVRIWFDQSGNTVNLTQTTDTMQPMVIISGAVQYADGEVGLRFAAARSSHMVNTSSFNWITSFSVTRFLTRPGFAYLTMSISNVSARILSDVNSAGYRIFNGTNLSSAISPSTTAQNYIYAFHNGSNSEIKVNNNAKTTGNSGSNNGTGIRIGLAGGLVSDSKFNGFYQELILYNSDQSANESGVVSNINSFYSIY